MTSKKVTFADIARYTKFSKTTISRYFNNPESLTQSNRDIIAQALIDLNYQENKLAKVLANGQTEFIGIIIPNLYMNFYAAVLEHLLNSYQDYHYKFLVFVGHENIDTERQYIQELLAYNIEGLIVLSHTIPSEELASYHIPIVSIEREAEHISGVSTDNYLGAVQATSQLIKSQCDLLIHINSQPAENIPSYGRIQGFKDTCQDSGFPYLIFDEDFGSSYSENQEHLQAIFEQIETEHPQERKGIFLSNDTYASIFLNCVLRKYGTLPDHYQIIGFDDSPIASECILPLTTIQQQIPLLTRYTMEMLTQQIHDKKNKIQTEPTYRQVPPKLIKRETTRF